MSFVAANLARSQPLQRSLAVALLVAVIGVIVFDVMLPIIQSYRAIATEIAENQQALRRFKQVATRLPRLEAEQASLKRALSAQDGYLKATSDSLIAAEMQGLIKTIAERAGADLRSTQILPTREEKGFRRVTARVELIGNANNLERVWYEMESGLPFLFIDSFDIEARQEPLKDRTQPPRIGLDVRFDVTAFARAATQ
jgi:general secretion pathway protein M